MTASRPTLPRHAGSGREQRPRSERDGSAQEREYRRGHCTEAGNHSRRERKENAPQQKPTEEKEEEEEQEEPTEENVTPQPAKAKAEAPKAAQEPSAEQEEEQEEQEEEQDKEDEPTVPSAAPLAAASAAQADNSSTSTPAAPTDNVITIVNNFVNDAKKAFSFVLDNVNIDRSKNYSSNNSAALTVKGSGDTEIELDGNNILKGGSYHAGLEKNDSDGTGTLTIKDDEKAVDGSKGSLLAVGNTDSAGIGGTSNGGNGNGNTSNITITGGNITAISGWYGAGIGGGDNGYGKDITITGDATVKASGYHGAGIGGGPGGGSDGSGKVTISGHANVIAFSNAGAGIGGGASGCADVTISEDATVVAQGYNGGTGIGTGKQQTRTLPPPSAIAHLSASATEPMLRPSATM